MRDATVSIITGTHNNSNFLLSYFRTLHQHTKPGYQLIIVDNGDDPVSERYINEWRRRLGGQMQVVKGSPEWGFAKFNNEALHIVTREFVCFVNDDILFSPHWLESMTSMMHEEKVGAVAKKLLNFDGSVQWDGNGGKESHPVDVAPATCFLVRREIAHFNPEYKGFYFEDEELCKKIKGLKFDIICDVENPVHHFGRATADKREDINELTEMNDIVRRNALDKVDNNIL